MFDATAWLDAWLAGYPWSTSASSAGATLIRAAMELEKDARLALHKEAVARLPILRAGRDDVHAWNKGSAVYELVVTLYKGNVSYREEDIVALLTSSKHACGHGADVNPPFEIAVDWARRHGVTAAWLAALRTFVDGMRGLRSAKANHLKTKGGLILLLERGRKGSSRCHSETFRMDLATLPPAERALWERLVLHMGTAMGSRMPKGYDVPVHALVGSLGVEQVIARLDRWLPRSDDSCRLETAGSHLFRNLVWLLVVMSRDERAASSCDDLVGRLARVEVTPAQMSKKLLVACAVYFAQRPVAVGRRPLEIMLARMDTIEKGSVDGSSIHKIASEYLSRRM
jgi:hypothetical protein